MNGPGDPLKALLRVLDVALGVYALYLICPPFRTLVDDLTYQARHRVSVWQKERRKVKDLRFELVWAEYLLTKYNGHRDVDRLQSDLEAIPRATREAGR